MIVVEDLVKRFGRQTVLNNVSLSCRVGDCIALIGPNGCGKTTLIKSLLGMVVPDSGLISFENEPIKRHWKYREKIGYMPQIGRYPDNMTIGQVLDMMIDIRKSSSRKLDEELVEAFGLNDLRQKRMRTLSGGTRQKVSACLAFMFNPPVLILDEPTAGLDPLSAEILKEKIQKEKAAGKLVLITSHILSDLDELITSIIYMQEGKVVFHKGIETLYTETGCDRLGKAIAAIMRNS
ncbi:MAG: ABC transporter ATP-binding protein [Ferruginibacter sp.]|nr:ABC transporter ATP-binding protein [Ferruginibacter sp.]